MHALDFKLYYAIFLPSLFPVGLPNTPTGLSSQPQAASTLRLQWEASFSLPGEHVPSLFQQASPSYHPTVNP